MDEYGIVCIVVLIILLIVLFVGSGMMLCLSSQGCFLIELSRTSDLGRYLLFSEVFEERISHWGPSLISPENSILGVSYSACKLFVD